MNHLDATLEILKKAGRIKLPGQNLDVVTLARNEVTTKGSCNPEFSDPIERTIKECLHYWTSEQKRGIWNSGVEGLNFYDYTEEWIDNVLEVELLYHVIESFSLAQGEV